jgi:DNA polymerase-3 subunit gamma/tau
MERLLAGEALPARAEQAKPAAPKAPSSYAELVAALEGGQALLAHQLTDEFRLVRYAPPALVLQQAGKARDARDLDKIIRNLREALSTLFGERWTVELGDGPAEPSLREQELAAAEAVRQQVLDSPLVKAAMDAFPGAELTSYSLDQRSA